jgi:hypothetical protein
VLHERDAGVFRALLHVFPPSPQGPLDRLGLPNVLCRSLLLLAAGLRLWEGRTAAGGAVLGRKRAAASRVPLLLLFPCHVSGCVLVLSIRRVVEGIDETAYIRGKDIEQATHPAVAAPAAQLQVAGPGARHGAEAAARVPDGTRCANTRPHNVCPRRFRGWGSGAQEHDCRKQRDHKWREFAARTEYDTKFKGR